MPVLGNARHERYAQGRAAGKTIDEAYILAGFTANRSNASRLNTNELIQSRISEILGEAAEKVGITKERVLAELGKIGFSDIRKLFSATGTLRRIEDLDDDAAACLSSVEVVTRKVPGSDDNEVEHTAKLKLWDKRAALVDIGKHLGMFTEKVEHSGPGGGPIEMADMDLARLITFQLTKASRQADQGDGDE